MSQNWRFLNPRYRSVLKSEAHSWQLKVEWENLAPSDIPPVSWKGWPVLDQRETKAFA